MKDEDDWDRWQLKVLSWTCVVLMSALAAVFASGAVKVILMMWGLSTGVFP